jgi:purine-binding chemotaxis protein CheW
MDLLEIRKKAKGQKEGPEGPPAPAREHPEPKADAVPSAASRDRLASPGPIAGAAPPAKDESDKGPAAEGPETDTDTVTEYLAFMLADEEYAVKVEDMREIIRLQHITSVPRSPDFILGITSIRGEIVPVFDIRKRLGLEVREPSRSTRILVISDDGSPHGMLVDSVTGVVRLSAGDIEPPPAVIGGVDAEYLEGVGRASGRMLILFNTVKVLTLG